MPPYKRARDLYGDEFAIYLDRILNKTSITVRADFDESFRTDLAAERALPSGVPTHSADSRTERTVQNFAPSWASAVSRTCSTPMSALGRKRLNMPAQLDAQELKRVPAINSATTTVASRGRVWRSRAYDFIHGLAELRSKVSRKTRHAARMSGWVTLLFSYPCPIASPWPRWLCLAYSAFNMAHACFAVYQQQREREAMDQMILVAEIPCDDAGTHS